MAVNTISKPIEYERIYFSYSTEHDTDHVIGALSKQLPLVDVRQPVSVGQLHLEARQMHTQALAQHIQWE